MINLAKNIVSIICATLLIFTFPLTLALGASGTINSNAHESSEPIVDEVFIGKVLSQSDTPDEWNVNLSSFKYYTYISLRALYSKPDSYVTISNDELDQYPYLKQALQNPKKGANVDDNMSNLLELLTDANTRNIMLNNTHYEVSFIVGDPLAPLPERYFELSVQQVIKTSTNVSTDDTVKILYSKSIEKRLNITSGDIIKVRLWQIEPARINTSLNFTLYQPVNRFGDILLEHVNVDSSSNQTKKNIPGFRAIILLTVMLIFALKNILKLSK